MLLFDVAAERCRVDGATLSTAVELARRLVRGGRASLMLPASEERDLRIAAASGLPETVAATARVRFGAPVSGLVAQTQQPLLVNDERSPRSRRAASYRTGSFISVPVLLDGDSCGVLNVADPIGDEGFHKSDLTTLQAFAAYIARDLAFVPAQERLQQLQDLVTQLRQRMIQAQEEERGRIARDLHDEAGHALTAAIFRLDLEALKLPTEADNTRLVLSRVRDSLVECTSMLHSIAFALRPRILEDLGLSPALRSLATQGMELGDVQIELNTYGTERRLNEEIELTLFRVVQEALTNIRKHAHATHVWVRVVFNARRVIVTVEDNGIGLGPQAVLSMQRPSLGLGGMRERIEVLAGSMEISERVGGGTRLVVQVPLRPERSNYVRGEGPRSAH